MEFVQVVSVENMRKSDARTIAEHTPSAELMYRAAQGIFNSAKFVGKVAIVCGKGNNGGDGYALACVLCKNGFTPPIFRAKINIFKIRNYRRMVCFYYNCSAFFFADFLNTACNIAL